MQFKWAIVGPGNIAHEFAHDLKFVRGGEHIVQAIVARDMQSAGEFAEQENVPECYDDLEQMLQANSVNAVYIATPHTLHYEQAIECLKRKVPVLCEKPIAINAGQVEEMIRTARATNTFLMEGMWIRFLPSIMKTLELVQSGAIGELMHIRADMSYRAPKDPGNRFFNPQLGGGSLLDLGIYPVYLSMLLFGTPDAIKATGRLSSAGIDETCAALFDYNSGQYAIIESSIITQTPLDAELFGAKGKLRIKRQWNEKPPALELELYTGESRVIELNWEGRGFQFEVEEVYACLQAGLIESAKMTHDFSLAMMRSMDEIRRQMAVRYPAEESIGRIKT